MTIDDLDAVEAALSVLRQNGIDIVSPRDGDLDDLEQERFNAVADACRAYASRRSSPAREQATEALPLTDVEIENALEDAAKAAFTKAQSVYRADHDHFPLKSTWETTDESIRDGWRAIARSAIEAAEMPPLGTQPEPRRKRPLAVIQDALSPSPTGGEAGAVAAREELIEKYASDCKRNAIEMATMPLSVVLQHFREFAGELSALTHPAQLMDEVGWRSMDSAPKDVDILVGGDLGHGWKSRVYRIRDEFWREDWEDEPTHWMPLPAAPALTKLQEGE